MSGLLDIINGPWAIVPERLLEIRAIYEARVLGDNPVDLQAVEASLGRPMDNRQRREYEVEDGVAIIPIQGVIAPKANLFTRVSGGASAQIIARQVADAAEDPSVQAILLDVDSPGGSVFGTFEAAAAIHAAAQEKPMAAWTDGQMASGAYAMGSAAGRLYLSSGAPAVGSIGVVATHVDMSRREQMLGMRTTEITAGKYKRIASQYGPLSDEGRASIQDQVDAYYALFVDTVAKHRGATVDAVLAGMADGRTFIGQQAINAGLVDGVMSRDALIEQLLGQARKQRFSFGATAPAFMEHSMSQTDKKVTLESLRTDHPDLAAALVEEGRKGGYEAGLAAGNTDGRDAGAKAERERMQAIDAVALPGYEKIVADAKTDGKSTGGDVALRIIAAQKLEGEQRLQAIRSQATPPVPGAAAPAAEKTPDGQSAKPERNPLQIAAAAQAYQVEQAKAGRKISVAEAVAHVTAAALA